MNIFTKHPDSIGESYFHHMKNAAWMGSQMVVGGLACLVHAICPFIFADTGSRFLYKILKWFITRAKRANPDMLEIARLINSKKDANS